MIVVDASAVLESLFATAKASDIDEHIFSDGQSIHAPFLIDVEIAQVIRRYELGRMVSTFRAELALGDFADLPIRRHEHSILLPRIWELRHNLSAYDATYVALSEALGVPLLTCDVGIAKAASHRAHVILI